MTTEPQINRTRFQRGQRYGGESPIMIVGRAEERFTVPGPDGKPLEVVYGKGSPMSGDATDWLTTSFRGEEVQAARLRPGADDSRWATPLIEAIEKREAEYQAKQRVKRARAEAAKNPMPAVLVLGDGLGDVGVRGIDQRTGKALITMPDGSKAQVSKDRLLRELDRDERLDVLRAQQALAQAQQARADVGAAKHVVDALKEAEVKVDLIMHYDRNTDERWTEALGRVYRGRNDAAVERQITVDALLRFTEYRFAESSGGPPAPLDEHDGRLSSYTDLYRTVAEWEAEQAADEVVAEKKAALLALTEEYRFDLTLFAEVAKEPDQPVDNEISIGGVRAPQSVPDWED